MIIYVAHHVASKKIIPLLLKFVLGTILGDLCKQEEMVPHMRNVARQRSGHENDRSTSTQGGRSQLEANIEARHHIARNVCKRIQ